MRTKFKRLRDAAAIIEGIPEKAFELDSWRRKTGKSLSCGTVCCAGGWLALHPQMKALGLHTDDSGAPVYKDNDEFEALARFFRIPIIEGSYFMSDRLSLTADIFGAAGHGQFDNQIYQLFGAEISDKQLFKYRVKAFLVAQGERLENP